MYYVTLIGKIYIRARGPEFDDPLGEMEDVKIFDFDDEIKWSDAALDFEYKRVSAGKNYDPLAMTAINDEKGRRAGEMSAPWFDDMNEMLDDFARSEDFEDFDEFDDFVSDCMKTENQLSHRMTSHFLQFR